MKLSAWHLAGLGVVIGVLYYAAKPVAKLTFYDPEIITPGASGVADPPTVISADKIGDIVGAS
jgi:hypothetical protein